MGPDRHSSHGHLLNADPAPDIREARQIGRASSFSEMRTRRHNERKQRHSPQRLAERQVWNPRAGSLPRE